MPEPEADLEPSTIVEVTSLEEDEPIVLEVGDDNPSSWPMPPQDEDDWDYGAHADMYANDPDVVLGEDNTKDQPEQFESQETST